jgi:hypothetical protein
MFTIALLAASHQALWQGGAQGAAALQALTSP